MKLSEAIIIGMTRKQQTFGEYISPDGDHTCALGAAADAAGLLELMDSGSGLLRLHLDEMFPILMKKQECPLRCHCPPSAFGRWSLGKVITHLNDHHYWTRAQIALWVKDIEDRMAPAPSTTRVEEKQAPAASVKA